MYSILNNLTCKIVVAYNNVRLDMQWDVSRVGKRMERFRTTYIVDSLRHLSRRRRIQCSQRHLKVAEHAIARLVDLGADAENATDAIPQIGVKVDERVVPLALWASQFNDSAQLPHVIFAVGVLNVHMAGGAPDAL